VVCRRAEDGSAAPPFIPPPEVQIRRPRRPARTITRDADAAPPTVITPVAPPAAPARLPAGAPAVRQWVSSARTTPRMGDAAIRRKHPSRIEKGEATILFTVGPTGKSKNAQVERATHPIFGAGCCGV